MGIVDITAITKITTEDKVSANLQVFHTTKQQVEDITAITKITFRKQKEKLQDIKQSCKIQQLSNLKMLHKKGIKLCRH